MGFFKFKKPPDYKSLDTPSSEWVSQTVNTELESYLPELGLEKQWKKNQWFGAFNAHGIKPVLEFKQGKGLEGHFRFGSCFDFIPSFKGSRVSYHRTDKSTTMHLFAYGAHPVSYWNKTEFEKTLHSAVTELVPALSEWYKANNTLEGNIVTARMQLDKDAFSIHWPNQAYVLAFLYAKAGDRESSQAQLQNFLDRHPEDVERYRHLIRNELEKLGLGK